MKFLSLILIILTTSSCFSQANDKAPEYPGGIMEMMKFVIKNKVYPAEAKKNKIVGEPIIKFRVDSTGKVKNPIVWQTSGNALLDKEALRIISIMPDWTPGSQNGRKVPVSFNLPVSFDIDGLLAEYKGKTKAASDAYYSAGLKDVELNKPESAIENFKKASVLNRNNSDVLYSLSAVYHNTNMNDSACKVWKDLKFQYNKDVDDFIKKYCN